MKFIADECNSVCTVFCKKKFKSYTVSSYFSSKNAKPAAFLCLMSKLNIFWFVFGNVSQPKL